jgi:hypothetical protein
MMIAELFMEFLRDDNAQDNENDVFPLLVAVYT